MKVLKEHALNIYPYGSIVSNPRAGGIGIVFVIINESGDPAIVKEIGSPSYQKATNQEMELEACIVGLERALGDEGLRKYAQIEVFTGSLYLQSNYKNAMFSWPKSQWRDRYTARPIAHVSQWKTLAKLIKRVSLDHKRLNINWMQDHDENPYQQTAKQAAKKSARNSPSRAKIRDS